jgi:hypothetical protein
MKPDLSKFFTPYKDPQNGATSYILTTKVAPVQQGFYFVNSSFTKDNRFLWFYCGFPPAGSHRIGRSLGVIDFEKQTINHYPETAFINCSPLVCDKTGGIYWATTKCICYRGPQPKDAVQIVAKLPEELYGERAVKQVATHLTLSPNEKELFLDSQAGHNFFAGTVNIETGLFHLWQKFERLYDHGQFCPIDDNLALLAQENMLDMHTGVKTPYEDRLWLLRRDGSFKPIFPTKTKVTHEWWDTDGKHVYAINNSKQFDGPAIIRVDPQTAKVENVWKGQYWHAHDFDHGRLFIADKHHLTGFYRGCPSSVYFIDVAAGKEKTIISLSPEHHSLGSVYHIDPHPRFSPDGTMTVFTVTVRAEVDVAVAFTDELLKIM